MEGFLKILKVGHVAPSRSFWKLILHFFR